MTKAELFAKEDELFALIRDKYGTTDKATELIDLVWELVDLAKDKMCEGEQ